jgi:hypothetical protein
MPNVYAGIAERKGRKMLRGLRRRAFERCNVTHSSCKRCSKCKGRTDLDAKVEDRWESSVFRSRRLLLRDLPRR